MISSLFVSLVKPKIDARLFGLQCGAPNPVNAGIKITFGFILVSLNITSICLILSNTCRLFFNQSTTAPAIKIDPSKA